MVTIARGNVSQLYQLESRNVTGLRLVPKLTKKGVNLPPLSRMKVFTAAPVISHSVSAALTSCVVENVIETEAQYTADFLSKIDKLFVLIAILYVPRNFFGRRSQRTVRSWNF